MARVGVDYETIKQTAVKLLSQGIAPSVQKIREVLGTGSNTTIAEHLKVWREEYAKKTIHYLPPNMPKELISVFEVLWQTAMEQAQNQLTEYKQIINAEHEAMLQRERDAEKSVIETKQKLAEISVVLEQEAANNQKINVELAVTKDRLIKYEEGLAVQKCQHEDRLKHIYEEKNIVIIRCHQLEIEIKALQEKLTSQSEKHQNILTQQNTLQEQSENRWLKLIDQAKQETIDARKKSEKLLKSTEEQIKNLNEKLSDAQQVTYDKAAQLKLALNQISQLKNEIKILENENHKAKTVIKNFENVNLKKQNKKNSILNPVGV